VTCFLRKGAIASVEILPLGLSDRDAIARSHALSAKPKGPFDGFEGWDRARFVFTHPEAAEKPEVRSGPGLLVASIPSGPVGLNIVKPPGSE
jgi:hypothetical protein